MPLGFGRGGTATRSASIGTSVWAITNEASSATMMVTATWVKNTMMSVLVPKIIGANTMIVVAVPAMTASPTSRTPLSVDSRGLRSLSARSLKMLSVTTTALSTSIPTASISPIIDRIFNVSPKKYSAPRVISIENGTDAVTIRVVETCRKKK